MSGVEILYIAPRIPYPLNTGMAIRQFHLLSAYSKVGRVNLVFFYSNEKELSGIEALKSYCASFHPISFDTTYGESIFSKLSLWRGRLAQMVPLKPLTASLLFSHEMQQVIEEIGPLSDLIHVSKLYMVPHIESLLKKKSDGQRFILDLDDNEAVFKRRMLQTCPPIRWQRRAFEYFDLLRLWLYQRKAIQWFDRIFVCSKRDLDYHGNNGKVVVVANGANVPPSVLSKGSDGKTLLYLGTFSYWPNIDGLFYFLKEVFPHIEKEITGVRLLIVGRNPPSQVTELHEGRRIYVEGDVQSVEKYYRRATISVVPLRIGAGTRLKILEAFALGRPVVSTSVGCEGLDVVNGEHLSVADDPKAFARSCIDLLMNPRLGEQLVFNARKFVEQNYTWDSIQSHVESLARELLEERPSGAL